MQAKILMYKYSDGSGFGAVRFYLPQYFEQAELDLEMMKLHASDCREWWLEEVDAFGTI